MSDLIIGKYVLVRCHDAGVHTGFLESFEGRQAILTEARRLWYWKPIKGAFLSAVSEYGLNSASKVGAPQRRLILTETCEIAECSPEAATSIREQPNSHE